LWPQNSKKSGKLFLPIKIDYFRQVNIPLSSIA
jgi:hypothetical protein